ncbi:Uncharacterised protein [Mycobacterium tuberculosis]|nr:Uncharacterised protein [Mycobacterium tuberculosis]
MRCQNGDAFLRSRFTSAAIRKHDNTEANMKPAKNIRVCPWLGVAPTIPDSALPNAPQ